MRASPATSEVVKDADALAARAAEIIAERLRGAPRPFRLVLSGGSTPRAAYQRLAQRSESALGLRRTVLRRRAFRAARPQGFQLPHGARNPAGRRHQRRASCSPFPPTARRKAPPTAMRRSCASNMAPARWKPGVPLFHLTLLGLGEDGHTASLLPGQPVLNERERWAAAVPQGRDEPRITLTYPALEFQRTDPVPGLRRGQARCAGPGARRRAAGRRSEAAGRGDVAGGRGGGGRADQGYGF